MYLLWVYVSVIFGVTHQHTILIRRMSDNTMQVNRQWCKHGRCKYSASGHGHGKYSANGHGKYSARVMVNIALAIESALANGRIYNFGHIVNCSQCEYRWYFLYRDNCIRVVVNMFKVIISTKLWLCVESTDSLKNEKC